MDVAHDRWTGNTLVPDTRSGTGKQERIVRSLFTKIRLDISYSFIHIQLSNRHILFIFLVTKDWISILLVSFLALASCIRERKMTNKNL